MTQTSCSDFIKLKQDIALGVLPVRDGPLGDVPEDGGLDQAGLGAVRVQVLLAQVDAAGVAEQGVLLVEGEESILEGLVRRGLPGVDEQRLLLTGRDALDRSFQFIEPVVVRVGVGGSALGLALETAR